MLLFHECGHAPLDTVSIKETVWLRKGSEAFAALKDIVMEKTLLAALPKLTKFCHTGHLEVFHSMLLNYCPKRLHYPYPGM